MWYRSEFTEILLLRIGPVFFCHIYSNTLNSEFLNQKSPRFFIHTFEPVMPERMDVETCLFERHVLYNHCVGEFKIKSVL